MEIKNYIDGKWVSPVEGKSLKNFNPSTGKVYSHLPSSGLLDVVNAIRAAHSAFDKWSTVKVAERARYINAIADRIEARSEEFALAESRDQGKPLSLARSLDVPRAIQNFRFFAGAILHRREMATEMDGEALNYVLRQPVGVAGLITPWNLPLYLLTWKLAPALACGNTVVCKPSELTPVTAHLLTEVLEEVGLPGGVCNMVYGVGSEAGRALVSHPGVPLISFTGGTETGRKIIEDSAPHFKKLSLELGGKNASIVLSDADLKKAVSGTVRSAFLNQGEICLCGSRVLVQESIYKEFLSAFVSEVKGLIVGDPLNEKTFMGPLISKAHLEKVKAKIAQAKSEDGRIETGDQFPEGLSQEFQDGYFLNPTVISDLTYCSPLHQEEIFGPVVTLTSFKYPAEAVKWANTTPYGLSASVWTQDVSKAHKIAAQLKVGTVWINTWLKRDLRMPFGGTKASGIGREGGEYSLDFFTETKTVCVEF